MNTQNITKWVEIEKFIQNHLGKRITTPKKKLKGSFKIKGETKIYKNDIFMAYPVDKGDALETYKTYLLYYNYTIQDKYEKQRIPHKAEWVEN